MTIILGIDPGLQHTGWGIIEQIGNKLSFIGSGVISAATKIPLAERLLALHLGINKVVACYHPEECAIEETFINSNASSSLKLGHARGALMLTASIAKLPVYEYAATLVKKSVVGVGRADKNQVEVMVKHLLPGCSIPSSDAADALAIAICHAGHSRYPR